MLYTPHFQLRAFDNLSEAARLGALVHLLEALSGINQAWLVEHPSTPWLYHSGVRYVEEPGGVDQWRDIPETLARGIGDCEDLACWRLAELRARLGEAAIPFVKLTRAAPRTLYHIAVTRANGTLEDPSRLLGMR